jgi:3,4-dihydroxy 2-butanone 4-phosphate synthase/GTP cyclohydrolase II
VRLVERTSSDVLHTRDGSFDVHRYRSTVDSGHYTAFVRGPIDPEGPTLVRMHAATLTADLLGFLGGSTDGALPQALARIAVAGGILLYIERSPEAADAMDDRDYGIGAQILTDLGARRLALLTDHPRRRAGLDGFDLEVVEYVPLRDASVTPLRRSGA